jgi:hypothetical protein
MNLATLHSDYLNIMNTDLEDSDKYSKIITPKFLFFQEVD